VLDLHRKGGICPDIEAHRAMFMPDGLHPNDAGAYRLAETMAAFLMAL
jgi:lysophospholipase L1-like esterase